MIEISWSFVTKISTFPSNEVGEVNIEDNIYNIEDKSI